MPPRTQREQTKDIEEIRRKQARELQRTQDLRGLPNQNPNVIGQNGNVEAVRGQDFQRQFPPDTPQLTPQRAGLEQVQILSPTDPSTRTKTLGLTDDPFESQPNGLRNGLSRSANEFLARRDAEKRRRFQENEVRSDRVIAEAQLKRGLRDSQSFIPTRRAEGEANVSSARSRLRDLEGGLGAVRDQFGTDLQNINDERAGFEKQELAGQQALDLQSARAEDQSARDQQVFENQAILAQLEESSKASQLGRRTQDKIDQSVVNLHVQQQGFKNIRNIFQDGFVGFKSNKRFALGNLLESVTGISVDEDFRGAKQNFQTQVRGLFNAYRKEITGAAAALQELQFLQDSFINDEMSTTQFKGAVNTLIAMNDRTIALYQEATNKGLKGDAVSNFVDSTLDNEFISGKLTGPGGVVQRTAPSSGNATDRSIDDFSGDDAFNALDRE